MNPTHEHPQYQHPEEKVILEGIYRNPKDDVARLMYADWLEDHAYSPIMMQHSEYIKVAYQVIKGPQVRPGGSAQDALNEWESAKTRSVELMTNELKERLIYVECLHCLNWGEDKRESDEYCGLCRGTKKLFRDSQILIERGFPSQITTSTISHYGRFAGDSFIPSGWGRELVTRSSLQYLVGISPYPEQRNTIKTNTGEPFYIYRSSDIHPTLFTILWNRAGYYQRVRYHVKNRSSMEFQVKFNSLQSGLRAIGEIIADLIRGVVYGTEVEGNHEPNREFTNYIR